LLDEIDISWFYRENVNGIDERHLKSDAYNWIARAALKHCSPESAFQCYERSYKAFPSLFKREFYFHLVGEKNFVGLTAAFSGVRQKLTFYAVCLVKKLAPGIIARYRKQNDSNPESSEISAL
jgi:hypothetical protein